MPPLSSNNTGTGLSTIFVLFILLILIVLVIIITLTWRIASRRYTLPCPVWMKGLLDPPFSQGMRARTKKQSNTSISTTE